MSSLSVKYDPEVKKTASDEAEAELQLLRKPPKRRVVKLKPPTPLERIFGQNKVAKHHYFTAGVKINESNQRNVHAEALPFKYPQDLEEFSFKVMSKAWRDTRRRRETQLKYNERSSYRGKQKLDLLNRLWVKEPQVKSMKTIMDLDDEFFSVIQGRPVPEKFNRWDYIADVRDILRTRIITGYREDEIMLIEENFITEQKLIEQIRSEFQRYVNTFEDFLFGDHTMSMALLRQSEVEAAVSAEKYEIFRELSKEYGSLKSIVYNLEEKWRNCKMYQKFLYLISPMDWRKQYDFYHIRKTSRESTVLQEEKSGASVFGRYKLSISGDILSLENLIDQFKDDVKIQDTPTLFFTDPTQLLKVFSFIEIQNLNTLLHSEELAIPLEMVNEGISKICQKFYTDMTTLKETIDSLEGGIIWEEERAIYLEKLAQELINGDFKELVSTDQVINLYVFVEDVYVTRVAPNDAHLAMGDMMRLVEMTYRNFLLQLDRLPDEVVYKAEMTCYREEARIMAVARDAARKVVQVERLMKHLARLLEPPVYKTTRSLKWRSQPMEAHEKPPPAVRALTQSEAYYLLFFEDFCPHSDDPTDFGICLKEPGTQTTLDLTMDSRVGAAHKTATRHDAKNEKLEAKNQ